MKRRTSDQIDEDEITKEEDGITIKRMERAREKEEERDGCEKNGWWKGYYLVEVKRRSQRSLGKGSYKDKKR